MENIEQSLQESTKKGAFIEGIYSCFPTIMGYLSIGFAAGVVEKTAGLSILEIAFISLFMYAGSGQFITASMIGASYPITAIIITIFFVNLRHLLMSASLAPYFKKLSIGKGILIGSQVTDETFGVASSDLSKRTSHRFHWMLGLNIAAYVIWFMANILGGLFGELISDTQKWGIDFALPAMFAGLIVLQMISRKELQVDFTIAILASLLVIGLHVVIPGSWTIILATVLATTVGMVIERWK